MRFLERTERANDGMIGASFGLHAAFTLSDRTLARCVEANHSLARRLPHPRCGGPCDAAPSSASAALGVLDERTLAAHCLHVSTARHRDTRAQRG